MRFNFFTLLLLLLVAVFAGSCSGIPFLDDAPQALENVIDTTEAIEDLIDNGDLDVYDYLELADMVVLLKDDLDALLAGYSGLEPPSEVP